MQVLHLLYNFYHALYVIYTISHVFTARLHYCDYNLRKKDETRLSRCYCKTKGNEKFKRKAKAHTIKLEAINIAAHVLQACLRLACSSFIVSYTTFS